MTTTVATDVFYRIIVAVLTWLAGLAGHEIADFLEQPDKVATAKRQPGSHGRKALLRHLLGYTVVQFAVKELTFRALGVTVPWRAKVAGQLADTGLHGIIDRSALLAWFAGRWGKADHQTRSGFFYTGSDPVTGRTLMDQAAHKGIQIPFTALITGLLARSARGAPPGQRCIADLERHVADLEQQFADRRYQDGLDLAKHDNQTALAQSARALTIAHALLYALFGVGAVALAFLTVLANRLHLGGIIGSAVFGVLFAGTFIQAIWTVRSRITRRPTPATPGWPALIVVPQTGRRDHYLRLREDPITAYSDETAVVAAGAHRKHLANQRTAVGVIAVVIVGVIVIVLGLTGA